VSDVDDEDLARSSQYVRIFELIKNDDHMTELLKAIVIHGCSGQLFCYDNFLSKGSNSARQVGALVKHLWGEACIPVVNNIMR